MLPGERMIWEGAPKRISIFAKSDLMVVPALAVLGAWYYFAERDGKELSVIWYAVLALTVLGGI